VVRLSHAEIAYGTEKAERVSVSVSPELAGALISGTVVVVESGNALCAISLLSGTGTCQLSDDELPVGRFGIVAIFAGNANFRGSTSLKNTLTVRSPVPVVISGS
jgi:hypothetical protein